MGAPIGRFGEMPRTQLLYLLTIVLSLGSSACSAQPDDCIETVTIDSIEYTVPARWCGLKLDSTSIADPSTLKRLPDELSFDSSRIYVHPQLREQFVRMAEAARKDSVKLLVDSGYRSASFQKRIIKRRMEEGETFENIARFVAPPGYSEHETGMAVDLVPSEARFVYTEAYRWLKLHGQEFGFIESIPEDSTGVRYWESWHWLFIPGTQDEN